MKIQGLRAKMKVYDDSDFFDTGYISFKDEEINNFNPSSFLQDPITDEEINDLFGVNEDKDSFDLDELIKYWKDSLPPLVDYAEMVGAPCWAYGHRYVYEDQEGYMIEHTISALEELKDTRKFVEEISNEIYKQLEISKIHLKEAKLLEEETRKKLELKNIKYIKEK